MTPPAEQSLSRLAARAATTWLLPPTNLCRLNCDASSHTHITHCFPRPAPRAGQRSARLLDAAVDLCLRTELRNAGGTISMSTVCTASTVFAARHQRVYVSRWPCSLTLPFGAGGGRHPCRRALSLGDVCPCNRALASSRALDLVSVLCLLGMSLALASIFLFLPKSMALLLKEAEGPVCRGRRPPKRGLIYVGADPRRPQAPGTRCRHGSLGLGPHHHQLAELAWRRLSAFLSGFCRR